MTLAHGTERLCLPRSESRPSKKSCTPRKRTPRVVGPAATPTATMAGSTSSSRRPAARAPAPTPSSCSRPAGRRAFSRRSSSSPARRRSRSRLTWRSTPRWTLERRMASSASRQSPNLRAAFKSLRYLAGNQHTTRGVEMKSKRIPAVVIILVSLAVLVLAVLGSKAVTAQDTVQAKYAVRVPNGLAFSEFRGYEGWQTVSISRNEKLMAVILANPVMINAYQSGIPGNGKPFPDGSKMAKIHWNPKKNETFPRTTVPASLHDVDFMVKDSKRFADSGGWGWAAFNYDAASDMFTPGTLADDPPQGNDAKCGLACHTIVKTRDYVFTDYGKR